MTETTPKKEGWKDKTTTLHAVVLRGDEEHREILVQPANEEGKFTLPIQEIPKINTQSDGVSRNFFLRELGIYNQPSGTKELPLEDENNRVIFYIARENLPNDLKGEWIPLNKVEELLLDDAKEIVGKVLKTARLKN